MSAPEQLVTFKFLSLVFSGGTYPRKGRKERRERVAGRLTVKIVCKGRIQASEKIKEKFFL